MALKLLLLLADESESALGSVQKVTQCSGTDEYSKRKTSHWDLWNELCVS